MRRFVLSAALLGAALVGALSVGCSGDSTQPTSGGKRVIILTNGESPFWDTGREGMERAAKELELEKVGLKIDFQVNSGGETGQLARLRQFASQSDIAAIAVSVTKEDNSGIADQLRELKKNGVHVLTIDSDVNRSKFRDARTAYFGTDNSLAGRLLGRCAKLLRPEGCEYVTFVGYPTAQNAQERVAGFQEGAGDKFTRKDNMADQTDRTKAKSNVRDARTNHPNANMLVGIWSYNAPAIVNTLQEDDEQKKKRTYTIVVFDAEPQAIKQMNEGWIDAMVVQDPFKMGYESTRLMKALVQDDKKTIKEMLPNLGQEGGDIFDTGIRVVVPDDSPKLKPETFDDRAKNIKGYKLSDFQQWLKENNLKGS